MRAVLIAALLLALTSVASAQSDSAADAAAVKRAKMCLAATQGKRLSDTQLKSFMSECLASTRAPQDLFDTTRTIERRCNTIANDRQLTAQDRVAFMQSCRRKGG
jgi:hypothetical protein